MTAIVAFALDRSNAMQVAAHLTACDGLFLPPLSDRVNVVDYSRQIVQKALRFEAWANGELVGLVAAYCNDPKQRSAFITSVSVLPLWQRQHIGAKLLELCTGHVRKIGFKEVELELDARNTSANAMYRKHGFTARRINERSVIMCLVLNATKET